MKKDAKKLLFKYAWLFIAAMVIFTACSDDDDNGPDQDPPVEDGFYIRGEATPFSELTFRGLMPVGINEVEQEPRSGMYEKYITINSGGAGFNIVQVAGAEQTEWGPASVETIDTEGADEQPDITIQRGTIGTSGVFTVPEDGLYHVILDTQTETFVIAPAPYWAILGGFSNWSDVQMPLTGGFSMDELNFTAEGVELREGPFKFRYGGGWKLEIAEDVKVNTNYGGVVSGTLPELTTTLERGGDDYLLTSDQEGLYTVNLNWTVEDGFVSTLTKTSDVEPLPEFPDELFMIGASVGGWDWAEVDLPMVPVHSKPHLFWKIVWIETGAEDSGFKFAPEKDWGNDFGWDENPPENGIYQRGGNNMPEPDESGYYMVVVNLETDEIAVVDPQVYLIGDPVGAWDTALEDALFTVDNVSEVLTITRNLEAGELRMYAWFDAAEGWFTDWWQSEFIILDGVIEFRGRGDDQERVNINDPGEYTIELDFRNNTGTVLQN